MANKVLYGLSDVHFGTYEVGANGTVTLGAPVAQPGAVSFSPEESGDSNVFYADNVAYFTSYGGGAVEGDLEVAMFSDAVKTAFMGYVALADGGLAQVKNASKPAIWMAFAVDGDEEQRRCLMFNGTFGSVTREYNTLEDAIEPVTESVPVSFVGDNKTGVTMVTYKPGDAGYDKVFTEPNVPTLPAE